MLPVHLLQAFSTSFEVDGESAAVYSEGAHKKLFLILFACVSE